jgi:NADPH:quinone reductase
VPTDRPTTQRQLRSTLTSDGFIELTLDTVPVPDPGPDEVLIAVGAAPVNPSDLGLLFGPADLSRLEATGTPEAPAVRAPVSSAGLAALQARVGRALPAGNEGAGVVVAAGSSPEAQALLGRTVAALGGALYAEYRALPVAQCLVLPDGTRPQDAASCFVNPLTALGMVDTMRLEGHTALVHTAAASNLGRMLVRICQQDGVPLVNIVRRPEQAALLHDLGAEHVCDSSAADFADDLARAIGATGATIAFDAIGGGELASRILQAMESSLVAAGSGYERYGSTTHKQVYLYGGLDRGPTILHRTFGMAWGVGGWLLMPFLARVGPERAQELRQRVADELHTTFASHYAKTVSLEQALDPAEIAVYARASTGAKYLITP